MFVSSLRHGDCVQYQPMGMRYPMALYLAPLTSECISKLTMTTRQVMQLYCRPQLQRTSPTESDGASQLHKQWLRLHTWSGLLLCQDTCAFSNTPAHF